MGEICSRHESPCYCAALVSFPPLLGKVGHGIVNDVDPPADGDQSVSCPFGVKVLTMADSSGKGTCPVCRGWSCVRCARAIDHDECAVDCPRCHDVRMEPDLPWAEPIGVGHVIGNPVILGAARPGPSTGKLRCWGKRSRPVTTHRARR